MNRTRLCLFALTLGLNAASALATDQFHFGRTRQTLAPRDSWGVLHTSPVLNETDFERRESWRLFYYNKSRHVLMKDPAYAGAVQEGLQRNGYYCGPIDGVWSEDMIEAIAKLQKAYGFRVNGALTISVRRALYLP